MSPPGLTVCILARDCADSLTRCLRSFSLKEKPAYSELVVVLGGTSTDDTEAVAHSFGATVLQFSEDLDSDGGLRDFSAARNLGLTAVTQPYWMWIDADDELLNVDQLPGLLADMEKYHILSMHLPYHYAFDDAGNLTTVHSRERVFRTEAGWEWVDRVHETVRGKTDHQPVADDRVVIAHRRQPGTAGTDRNIRLLELQLKERPEYSRTHICLGDAYFDRDPVRAIIHYGEFFKNPTTDIQAWHAAVQAGWCSRKLERWEDVLNWCLAAIGLHPEFADPYVLLAHYHWFAHRDADRTMLAINDARRRAEAPIAATFRNPQMYTVNIWDVEHRAVAAQGNYGAAMGIVKEALVLLGRKPEWEQHLWFYLERDQMAKSAAGALQIVNHLFRRGDTLRARRFLETCLPLTVRDMPEVRALYGRVRQLTKHVDTPDGYRNFYSAYAEHRNEVAEFAQKFGSSVPQGHVLNATAIEPARLTPILERLRERGVRRILDVGCGAGEPAFWLEQQGGFEITALDINRDNLAEAKRRRRKYKSKVRFIEGSLDTLGPKQLGTFDAVLLMELIEHLPPDEIPFYLSVGDSLLKPGGCVFLTTPGMLVGDIPSIETEFPRDHVQEFSRADLEQLVTFSGGKAAGRWILNMHKVYKTDIAIPGWALWMVEYDRESAFTETPVEIYIGPGLEHWTPDSVDEGGIGGSETWAVLLARELRQMGHAVTVYAEADGWWDGVRWLRHELYDPKREVALRIISRWSAKLDERGGAAQVLFWAHDTDYPDFTEERAAKADGVVVLSEWQRQHWLKTYPWMDPTKVHVIGHGIVAGRFQGLDGPRYPHRIIWTSSPDRGLDHVLGWWPAIRKMWPDAELKVFYGFENMQALARHRPWLSPFIDSVRVLMRQPGVEWVGRVGQERLAQEMASASFWVYPSKVPGGADWAETFCISALEVQAAGCVPICSAAGALPERLNGVGMMLDLSAGKREYLGALRDWDRRLKTNGELIRARMREWALAHTWRDTALKTVALAKGEPDDQGKR